MGSKDPGLRARQLAALRAAYEACADQANERAGSDVALHARVLLGRILIVLGGMPEPSDPDC